MAEPGPPEAEPAAPGVCTWRCLPVLGLYLGEAARERDTEGKPLVSIVTGLEITLTHVSITLTANAHPCPRMKGSCDSGETC